MNTHWTVWHRLTATTLLSLLPVNGIAVAQTQTAPGRRPVTRPAAEVSGATRAATPRALAPVRTTTTAPTTRELMLFGPQRYVRTTGPKDVYTTNFALPAWLVGPFRLRVQNGEPDGTFRVSSAIIELNGVVAAQNEFNQNVPSLDKVITGVKAANTLKVTLSSKPTSYLTISIFATSADYTAPQLTWIQPAPASTINTAVPRLLVRYGDAIGTDEPSASGVDTSTLRVLIDNVDRSALFTRRSDEAGADIPATAPLAAGVHAFKASITDAAGNKTEITGEFRIDLTPPQVQIIDPVSGAYLPTRQPSIRIRYADETAINLASLRVLISGVDKSSLFITRGPTEASITWDSSLLADGPNQINVHIEDLGGNVATHSVSFNSDTTAPVLTVAQPGVDSKFGTGDIAVTLSYSDDQAIDPTTASAAIDGAAITLTTAADKATSDVRGLSDGAHTLTARIADRAGNASTASVPFSVDTAVPQITVVEPPAGENIKTNQPAIVIEYEDQQGVAVDTLKVSINGVDRRHLFAVANASAAAQITGFNLPEGINEIVAEIYDLTSNLGRTISRFFVDTTSPAGSFEAPAERVNTGQPTVTVRYSDNGSGIDPTSVRLVVDGQNSTSLLSVSDDAATAILTPALADGPHAVSVTFADRAGNPLTISRSFIVDTVAPQVLVGAPANNSFINTTAPALRVAYSDAAGTGIDLPTLSLSLTKGTDAPIDITSYVTASPIEAVGLVPDTARLTDGTYRLRADIRDLAGNIGTYESAFEVDTVAPTYRIEAPAANGYVATSTPSFSIVYDDERSGIDTARAKVRIDLDDRTEQFVFGESSATGTLTEEEALADGPHTIELELYDRAGNRAASVIQAFNVDTIAPTSDVEAPVQGTYLGPAPYVMTVVYADGGGIDPTSVRISIDTTDRTGEFSVTADRATATIATPLADGAHTISVSALDWSGNSTSASSSFTVDALAPVVEITSPAASAWLTGSTVAVIGAVTDASPVLVEVNGIVAATTSGPFTVSVPATDGQLLIKATARDAAGNTGTAEVTVNVDSAAPVINVAEPVAGFATNAATATIRGSITDVSAVTLTLDDQPLELSTNSFTREVALPAEGDNTFTLVATDAARNSSTATVVIIRDTIAPTITVASPVESSVLVATPVVVRGTFSDATAVTITVDGVQATLTDAAFEASISDLAEGEHALAVVATDAAGNATTVSREITVDLSAPTLTIEAPVNGSLTKEAAVTVTGTAEDITLQSVTANGITATLSAGDSAAEKEFSAASVPLVDGENRIVVIATDAALRTTESVLLITRDSVAPTVIISAPDQITRSRGAQAAANVDDNVAVATVVFKLGTEEIASLTESPWEVDIVVPDAARPGDILTLTVIAIDTAGNSATSTHDIRVIAEGSIVGQVLSDITSLPIQGARVRIEGAPDKMATTDARGRYALPANDSNVVLIIEHTINGVPTLPVERTVAVQSGVGTIPVDARLSPLGPLSSIGAGGGTLSLQNVSVTIPAGVATAQMPARLTMLSPQGLPNLLPLGWTPIAAFHVLVDPIPPTNAPLSGSLTQLPSVLAHLVEYKPSVHAWVMVQPNVAISGGTANVALPDFASYALVVGDSQTMPIPAVGEPLVGVEMLPVPDLATSSGQVSPAVLPPSGGSAIGTLVIQSPTPMPSGTVVQAEVTETFSMSSGEVASEERRTEDIILYRDLSSGNLSARFPIVPARTFASSDLVEGKVHLDILAGRESVRGKTGGTQALTLTSAGVILTVPAGSLPSDSAISLQTSVLSRFLPSTIAAVPFAEVVIDLAGLTLSTSAALSVSAELVGANETVLIARIDRINGVPRPVVVAATDRVGDRFISRVVPELPGVHSEGRFVFYRVSTPWSIVTGTVASPFGLAPVVVQAEGLPFVAVAGADGKFVAIAPVGTTNLTVTIPNTSVRGSASVQVVSGQTVTVAISASPTTTSATISPATGTLRVPVSAQIEITANAPLHPASLSSVRLNKQSGEPVGLRYVLSGSGRVLAAVPLGALEPGTVYVVVSEGLRDTSGGAVVVPETTFTTAVDVPPSYDTNRIVFRMPDANGLINVSAPAGSLPPGTNVLIVNSGNGVVVSYGVGNDGSFSGDFPGSIDDRLLVTITDPAGNVVNFERSKFVFTDGSGRTAIGPSGGVVEGTNGTAIIIPDGALVRGAVFKVEYYGLEKFSELPTTFPGARFGGGLSITSEEMPTLREEGKLVFPKPPEADPFAFYFVFRRVTGPNGRVDFEAVDHAFVNAEGKVATASFPWIGWNDSVGAWEAASTAIGLGLTSQINFALMWLPDALRPGVPLPGVVVGKAYQLKYVAGQAEPIYEPVNGAMISAIDESGMALWAGPNESHGIFARSQTSGGGPFVEKDGTFSFWDPKYTGGTVRLHGMYKNFSVTATAFQANPVDSKSFFTEVFAHYRNVASATITFPADSLPQAPDLSIHVMTLAPNLFRQEISGVAIADVPVLIGMKLKPGASGELTALTVNGEPVNFMRDNGLPGIGSRMDFRSTDFYIPTLAGTYNIKATVINPQNLVTVDVEHTFLVVAAGGNNNNSIPGPPDWITQKLVPRPGDTGVGLAVLPQVVFTEPVNGIVAGLTFTSSSGRVVSYTISGVGIDRGAPFVIPDMKNAPATTAVTSITIQPVGGFEFGQTYTLKLTGAIKDLDTDAAGNPAPRPLPARTLTFTTLGPGGVGASDETFESPGMVILGGYAYVARRQPGSPNGFVQVFNLSDLSQPSTVGRVAVSGQPIDLSGESNSPLTDSGSPALFGGSGLKQLPPGPSNVYLWDLNNPEAPKRIAVVSVTESMEEGTVLKVFLKKTLGYTITYPHGIQVIDLAIAKKAHAEAEKSKFTYDQMLKGIVLAGIGFGQEAVVQSILVRRNGLRAHLLDLQAGDYIVNGTQRRLIYATGDTPFVIVDPADSSPIKMTEATRTLNGHLSFGRAIVLARVAGRDLAITVGTGEARVNGNGALKNGFGLMVYDLSNPLVPNLVGSHSMNESPTDLAVSGATILVATAEGLTLGYSVADPDHIKYLGSIANTGPRIAVSETGGLYGTTSPQPGSPMGGAHVGTLQPVILVNRVEPIKIEVQDGTGTVDAPVRVTALEPETVIVRVEPNMRPDSGKLRITNQHFQRSDGSDGGVTTAEYDILWTLDEKGKHIGKVTLPAGKTYEDTELIAVATAQIPERELTSTARRIKLGWVKFAVDSNNNTEIDNRDDEAKRKGRAFGFWESDKNYEIFEQKKADPDDVEDVLFNGLTDYATVQFTVNKHWWAADQGSGKARLRLVHPDGAAKWSMVKKVSTGNDHLQEADTAVKQRAEISGAEDVTEIPICVASEDKLNAEPIECRDNEGFIIIPKLTAGIYEYLFRCENCNRDAADNPADTLEMLLEYVKPGTTDGWTVFDRARVDIRPFEQWATVMSVRDPNGMSFKPLSIARAPKPLEERPPWANSTWPATQIPPTAKDVTVLVHGYNVTHEAFAKEFFPTYVKRLYWVGHPLLRRQGEWWKQDDGPGCVHDCAHVVGFSWPSNDSGESSVDRFFTRFEPIREAVSGLQFPQDEFHAFQTGPPLAKYLKSLRNQRGDRRINVVAHSLGNLAVNAALSRPEMDPAGSPVIDKFVMNQAAFPAEAMAITYTPTVDELNLWPEIFDDKHAETYGFPDDAPWKDQLEIISPLELAGIAWRNTVDQLQRQAPGLTIDPIQFYERRWTQIRPFPLPDYESVVRPDRGPWKALFGKNPFRTRIFNTYSENDRVVGVIWRANQRLFKPLSMPGSAADFLVRKGVEDFVKDLIRKRLGIPKATGWLDRIKETLADRATIEQILPGLPDWRSQDNNYAQTWALKEWTEPRHGTVFGDGQSHWTALRQYAELAFWFPSTSYGAGVKNIDDVLSAGGGGRCRVDPCNMNFTKYSGPVKSAPNGLLGNIVEDAVWEIAFNVKTHGYMAYRPLTEVWDAHKELRKILDPKN